MWMTHGRSCKSVKDEILNLDWNSVSKWLVGDKELQAYLSYSECDILQPSGLQTTKNAILVTKYDT